MVVVVVVNLVHGAGSCCRIIIVPIQKLRVVYDMIVWIALLPRLPTGVESSYDVAILMSQRYEFSSTKGSVERGLRCASLEKGLRGVAVSHFSSPCSLNSGLSSAVRIGLRRQAKQQPSRSLPPLANMRSASITLPRKGDSNRAVCGK